MATKRPIYIDEVTGRFMRFKDTDELPNQQDIKKVYSLVALLLLELLDQGVKIKNDELLRLLDEL